MSLQFYHDVSALEVSVKGVGKGAGEVGSGRTKQIHFHNLTFCLQLLYLCVLLVHCTGTRDLEKN